MIDKLPAAADITAENIGEIRIRANNVRRSYEVLTPRQKKMLSDSADGTEALGRLEAAENKTNPEWNLLRIDTQLARGQFTKAAVCCLRVEEVYPRKCWPMLEQCYRELGDFKQAYAYACKQR
jgi:hypothetical protein